MTPERIDELNKIGFNWEIRRVSASRKSTALNEKLDVCTSSTAAFGALQNLSALQVNMMPPSA